MDETADGTKPEISIVMPTRNRAGIISRQIEAVQAQNPSYRWELVVVDNGSTDDTREVVGRYATVDTRVRLHVATAKPDAAYARNEGVSVTTSPKIAFVDDDDLVGRGWLEALVLSLDEYPLVASAMEYDLLNRSEVTDGWPLTQVTSLRSIDGFIVSTGHVGIRREHWDRLGGQREGFRVGEDMEMTLRSSRDFGIPPRLIARATYHRQLPTKLRGAFKQGERDGRGRVQWSIEKSHHRMMSVAESKEAARAYWWVVSRAPYALVGRRRYLWMLRLGERAGQFAQSISSRAFYL